MLSIYNNGYAEIGIQISFRKKRRKSYKFNSCYPYLGGYSSIGRITVCGTDGSLFDSGYPPLAKIV